MKPELLSNYAAKIDHTLLRPDATRDQIANLCLEAEQNKFATVCVAPCWLGYIEPSKTYGTTTVIGFPHGNSFFLEKINSSQGYIAKGATELDIVANIGFIKSGDWQSVEAEVELFGKLRERVENVVMKYIVEVGYLTDDELFKIADMLIKHKMDYIKTCTGYGPRGVTPEDIAKIKKHVGDAIKIKASGGIASGELFLAVVEAGADRVGTSSSVRIMESLNMWNL